MVVDEIKLANDYTLFLIALTVALNDIPKDGEELLERELYTLAWFDEMLPFYRIHYLKKIEIESDYSGKAGLTIEFNGSFTNKNVGCKETWEHRWCIYRYHGIAMNTVLDINNIVF